MRKILERCPGCDAPLEVSQLTCVECDTVIHGHFAPCSFCKLSPENLRFAESFIRLRGNIKDMERELGVSYPTVRSRLNAVIKALGFEPKDEGEEERDEAGAREAAQEVLAQLERGEIDVTEAVARLRGGKAK